MSEHNHRVWLPQEIFEQLRQLLHGMELRAAQMPQFPEMARLIEEAMQLLAQAEEEHAS